MSLPALETSALGKRYHSLWALRDCTLAVPAGSVTALVGPNGAGKTTLLQLAVGLSEPSEGRVLVFGASPREAPREVLPRIGFVALDRAARGADRRDRGCASPAHRRPFRPGSSRAHPRARARKPHRASDHAARARERPSVRHPLAGRRGEPRGDRARISRPPHPARGSAGGAVTWLSWRQQRLETFMAAALLALAAATLVPLGLHMAS